MNRTRSLDGTRMNLRGTTYRTVRSQNTKGLERTALIEIKLYWILYLEKGYVVTAFFMCNRRSWMFFSRVLFPAT